MFPTPTPLPVSTPMITLNPDSFRIWEFTDEALHLWDAYPSAGLAFQWTIIIFLIVVFVVLLIKLFQEMMSER